MSREVDVLREDGRFQGKTGEYQGGMERVWRGWEEMGEIQRMLGNG